MWIGFSISLASPSGHNINQIQTSSKSSRRISLHFSGKKVQHPYSYSLLQKILICSFTQNHPPTFSLGMLLHSITCSKGCTELIVVFKALTGCKRSFMHFIPMKTKWEEDKVRDDDDGWWWYLLWHACIMFMFQFWELGLQCCNFMVQCLDFTARTLPALLQWHTTHI